MKIIIQTQTSTGVRNTPLEIPSDVATDNYTIGDLKRTFLQNQTAAARLESPVTDLALFSTGGHLLDDDQTLESCGVRDGDTVCLKPLAKSVKGRDVGKHQGQQRRSVFLFLLILIVLCCIAALIAVPYEQNNPSSKALVGEEALEYAVVMDAGSSHTNLAVYVWDSTMLKAGTGQVYQHGKTCTSTASGISSFFDDPDKAAESLKECLIASTSLVPSNKYGTTHVYLGATAGMRLLRERNVSLAQGVIHAVRRLIHTYPYVFEDRWARILPGNEEGLFGWVTVNYLSGPIGVALASDETSGALDLGGASTQITFIPSSNTTIPKGYSYPLSLYGEQYTPYTYSFLCFGLNEARRRYLAMLVKDAAYANTVDNPCGFQGDEYNVTGDDLWTAPCSSGPEGLAAWGSTMQAPHVSLLPVQYCKNGRLCTAEERVFTLRGTSNIAQCIQRVQQLFPQLPCNYSSCSFNGIYQPPLTGNFSAFAGYYYQASVLNLTGDVQVGRFRQAADGLCAMPYREVVVLPGIDLRFVHDYCFNCKYASELLSYGLRFSDTDVVHLQKDINGTDVGWALGFMINATNIIAPLEPQKAKLLSSAAYTGVLLLLVLALLLCFALTYFLWRSKRRHANYKPLSTSADQKYGAV